MNVAFVHDSLVEFGGAERVLAAMLSVFPQAHVYTGFYKPHLIQKFFPKLQRSQLHATWIQNVPIMWTHTSLFQSIAPFVWRTLDLSGFDLVISHTNHLMCNMVYVPHGVLHMQYIQSPPKNIFGIDPLTPWQRFTHYEHYVKFHYKRALRATPHIVTNSHHTKRTLKRLFGVTASVLYPPVSEPKALPRRATHPSYCLMVSRLDRGKNFELAIAACNQLRMPLKIVGITNEPRYERYLRSIAGPTIEFLGFVDDSRIAPLYEKALCLMFPSYNEDFGIVPLEANAHGVPVIGFPGGGTKETVIEGKTGTFIHRRSVLALMEGIQRLQCMKFDSLVLWNHAKKFSYNQFKLALTRYVNEAIQKNR